MTIQTIRWSGTLCLLAVLLLSTVFPSLAGSAREPGQVAQPAESVLIRLAYVTFDPLQQFPDLSGRPAYTPEEAAAAGIYILQFSGPVLPEWKQAVLEAGGQLDGYLPDYAFIARLDGAALARVRVLPFVRWVGPYEPAYRLAADATGDETRSYRVALASWADPAAARSALAALGVRTDGDGPIFLAEMDGAQLDAAARLPDVVWIEPYRPRELHNDVGGGTIMGGSTAWANGYTGSGVTIGVADTGLDTGNPASIHQDFSGRVTNISSWPVVYANWGAGCITQNPGADDGPADVDSGHGSHVTGSVAGSGARSSGQFRGLAYEANITFQAVEQWTDWPSGCPLSDGYYLTGIPADERDLFTQAYGWGARVHNNSWGSSAAGAYDQTAANFDDFIHDYQDMTIVVSAGNSGRDADANGYVDTDSIGSPGTAKNVITVGASDNERSSGGYSAYTWGQGWPSNFPANPTRDDRISDNRQELAAFSSRGPADDGRILPDVVAPGTDIVSVRSSLASGTGWGVYNAYYMYMGGTSMASPLTAGAAALVRDYYQTTEGHSNPSAALIKATLINTAVDVSGYGNTSYEAGQPIPNNHEGWGRVNVAAATTPGRQFVDDWTGLNTGQTATYQFSVNAGQPFKVTLVWSDAAGTPGAGAALVNNLNLRVTAPDGTTTYWGNHFSGGWTTPGGSADTVNNVENVYIQSPTAGTWTVQVIGQNVPQGPQSFALVVGGSLVTPLSIATITPSGGLVGHTVHATITGGGFGAGTTVRLTRSGQPDINGTGVSVLNQSTLTCNFNLAGAALGAWNVVVSRDANSATLPNGFTVSAPVADLYLPIIIRAWPPLPGQPTINPFVPNPDPDGNYTVVWTPGAGPAPTSYQLEENGVVIATGYVGTSYPISGRTPGTYTYRVRGQNAYGYGLWSAPQSVTVSPPPTNPIQNGDFEQGAVIWTQYSTHGWPLIINTGFPGSVTPHSGSWAVWLGGDYDDISYIAQTVTIPSGSTVLSFYYWIASQDYCGYDFGGVIINGTTVVDQFDLCTSTNTGGWVRRTVNLAAYAGQTVQIQIRAETDSSFNSNLFVDDVALGASLGRERPAPTRPFDPATAAPRE